MRHDHVELVSQVPPGAPADLSSTLVPRLNAVTRVAVDTSEAPLAAVVDRMPGSAELPKPNAEELHPERVEVHQLDPS